MSVLGKRVGNRLSELGMNQSELARKVGMRPQGIQSIVAGDVERPRKLREIAAALETSEEWLLGETDRKPSARNEWLRDTAAQADGERAGVPIAGDVAAGNWIDPEEMDEPRENAMFVPRDPRYPLKDQRVYIVRGRSIEQVARDGAALLCLSTDSGVEPQNDDLVIAERQRGGLIERTAKRLRILRNGIELVPEYLDPALNKPIALVGDEDDSLRIVAIVLHIYASPKRG